MSSPVKNKDKKKEPEESKKKQLLKVFHQQLDFLKILTPEDLDLLEDKLHIFVFTRGQPLAKEKEIIDYLGIIAEGRAVAKSKNYQIGDIIGHNQLLGYAQQHTESITGQSDGVIICIRIYDITTLLKPSLCNKIIAYLTQVHATEILKRQDLRKQSHRLQTQQPKKLQKYLTPQWSQFFSQLDPRQKNKFYSYFPFLSLKQKDLVMNISNSKSVLLYVVRGQLVAKIKQQSKVIQNGQLYNSQGFLTDQTQQQNIYCLSSDADVLAINKQILQDHFKSDTFKAIIKIALKNISNIYLKDQKPQQSKQAKKALKGEEWTIFKKHPEREIVPLPKKSISLKTTKPINNSQTDQPLLIYQTLFKDQLGTLDGKLKTNTSVADTNYQKLYSLKTQPQQKQISKDGQLQKLKKQVQILSEKLKLSEEMSKGTKLDLIENKSRLGMNNVLKQIKKLYQQEQVVHPKAKMTEGETNEGLMTFKQAFDKQAKENKIQELVAKCAFRWLYLTRKHKSTSNKI